MGTILVIDDDEDIWELFEQILSKDGHKVITALTAQEGYLKAEQFDVAIIDKNLPDMDGVELLTRLKELDPDSYCIMATGYASLESSIEALNEGAYAYMHIC